MSIADPEIKTGLGPVSCSIAHGGMLIWDVAERWAALKLPKLQVAASWPKAETRMVHEPVNSVCGAGFDERKAGVKRVARWWSGMCTKLKPRLTALNSNPYITPNEHEALVEVGVTIQGLWASLLQLS